MGDEAKSEQLTLILNRRVEGTDDYKRILSAPVPFAGGAEEEVEILVPEVVEIHLADFGDSFFGLHPGFDAVPVECPDFPIFDHHVAFASQGVFETVGELPWQFFHEAGYCAGLPFREEVALE